jgi:hypothetical protein
VKSKTKTVVVLVVILSLDLVIAACGGSRPAPTPGITVEDLIGMWYDVDRREYLQLNEDGTYRVAMTVGFIEASPYELGQYRLEGTLFTFITSDESPDCQGQTGRYQVELTEQGQLQFELQEDPCQARADEQPGSWETGSGCYPATGLFTPKCTRWRAACMGEERSRTVSNGKRSLQLFGLALAVLLLAGCGGAQAVPTETPVPPTATPTPVPPTATPESISWDYVVLGDSIGGSFASRYAKHIEADLGIEVTMHVWYRGQQGSSELVSALRNNQELQSDLREAEVVTFLVTPRHLKEPRRAYRDGTCGGTDNQDCLREALRLYKADTDAIIAEILSLRSTSDTIIRAMTVYNNHVNDGKEWGYFEGLNPYWVAFNEYLVQAASVHDIPVARVDLTFNGPNLDEDPSDKDLLGDVVHPNAEGTTLIADLFRELGYEPLAP